MTEPWELPEGWQWADFQEVAKIASELVSPANHQDEPHIAPNHIESGSGRLLAYTTIASDQVTSSKHRFRSGQILYSKIRPYLCKAILVDFGGLCSADMYPITSKIDARYLHRWMISLTFTEWASGAQGRTVLPKINQEALSVIQVPVPPLAEQQRIVAKIDELTARSRAARAALAEVPTLLEQLRQSVLAYAFRGDLTADWRDRHPNAEPATVLLDRIRAERRKQWDVKYPKKKYVEPEPVDDSDLPDLPESWCWVALEELAEVQLGQRRAPEYIGKTEYAYIRSANITWEGLDLTDVKRMGFDDAEPLLLRRGDILLNEASGSPTEVGKPALWNEEIPSCCIQATVIRLRGHSTEVSPLWLFYHSLRDALLAEYAAKCPGLGIIHLTAKLLRTWPVALAPLAEQTEIIRRLDMAECQRRSTASAVSQALLDNDALDQSILAKAFRGELVPQDPADEPVAELLARIRSGGSMSHSATTSRSIQRGRVRFYILLLLRTWKKPLGREMLERGLVLMLNSDVRRAILGRSKLTTKRAKNGGTAPQFVRGLDVLLGEMLDDGQLVPGPDQGFFAEGRHGMDLETAPKSDHDAVRETAEAMKMILKDKHQAMDAEIASELHGEVYEVVS